MKKRTAALLAIIIFLNVCITSFASSTSEQLVAEETSAYMQEEALAAMAIANSDSFVTDIATQENFDIPCKSAILMEESTGQILYTKNPDEKLSIASITKVMTMLLIFEALDEGKFTLKDTVPISEHAYSMGGSQIWLEPGEIFSVDELLKAIAVHSANDAAVAMAEFVGGSESVFCDMMNKKAAQLGMVNTNFVNACGLDEDNHYSSAHDVAIMSRELMKHEKVFNYTTIWMEYLRNGETQLLNTNKMLKSYTGMTGLKTGTTSKAGVCISATAKRGNLSLIAVVLGSASGEERFSCAKKLLDFGFSNFESVEFPDISVYPPQMRVMYAVEKSVPLQYCTPKKLLMLKGSAPQLSCKVAMPEYINAPMNKDDKIGTISLYSQNGKIKDYDIILTQDTVKLDFNKALSLLTKAAGRM